MFYFSLITIISLAQFDESQIAIVKVIDANNSEDSVIFGFNDNATEGIDESLGEKNIIDSAYKDLDIRLIQRNYDNKSGYWLYGSDLYMWGAKFNENIDTKIDLRQYSFTNDYIIEINAINYPIIVKINIESIYMDILKCLYKDNTPLDSTKGEININNTNDTIFLFKNQENNLLLGFHPYVLTDAVKKLDSSNTILISQINKNELSVKANLLRNCSIINQIGVVVDNFSLDNLSGNIIDISNLSNGIYILKCGNFYKKFIKD